jgi:hypothetical protein
MNLILIIIYLLQIVINHYKSAIIHYKLIIMSGNVINRPKCIDIILDKVFNKSVPKPVNLHSGNDIEYIM